MLGSVSLHRVALAGATALALSGALLGAAAAQPATPAAQTRHQQIVARAAQALGISPDTLQQALKTARQQVAPAPHLALFQGKIATAASALHLSVAQVHQELRGHSLADVAKAHGADPAVVANALKATATQRIDQAVSVGKLTTEQAAKRKAGLDARVQRILTRQHPATKPHG
jgi:hypothetical protein